MYTLYKDEKGLPEHTVAALFTTGFVTAGITASFVGSLADQYGRRAACLIYCITYSLSCLSVTSNDVPVLYAGRALGGLSTTLQFTVFETWMISEYHKRDLNDSLELGSIFSFSVTLSSILAIVAGVIGQAAVQYTGSKTAPFILAIICLATAFVCVHQIWCENYGEAEDEKSHDVQSLRAIFDNHRILALGLVTTLFEGSILLFVFFWSPALISSRARMGDGSPLPFGIIFSCFMCAMMLGSLTFAICGFESYRDVARFLLTVLALASCAVLMPVLQTTEGVSFWAFVAFEMCLGLYIPTVCRLKAEIVEDGVRAKVYGLMRLPLNAFVVIALGLTKDGDDHRARVFTAIGAFMLIAFWVAHRYLN